MKVGWLQIFLWQSWEFVFPVAVWGFSFHPLIFQPVHCISSFFLHSTSSSCSCCSSSGFTLALFPPVAPPDCSVLHNCAFKPLQSRREQPLPWDQGLSSDGIQRSCLPDFPQPQQIWPTQCQKYFLMGCACQKPPDWRVMRGLVLVLCVSGLNHLFAASPHLQKCSARDDGGVC